jgi:four helix bundle protein
MEVETQVMIAQNLGYLDEASGDKLTAKAAELGRILNGRLSSLKR